MLNFTTPIEERDLHNFRLTRAEAEAMYKAGFRFAEYNEEHGRFRVSRPFQVAENLLKGTVTIMQ